MCILVAVLHVLITVVIYYTKQKVHILKNTCMNQPGPVQDCVMYQHKDRTISVHMSLYAAGSWFKENREENTEMTYSERN